MLQVRLLGQFELYLDGTPVIIPSRPTQSLFAFLILNPLKSHRREMLAGQFWPDASETNARSNLRHALWRIRKAFGERLNERIHSDDLGVTFYPQPDDQVDVYSFEACVLNADCIDEYIKAISAYGGDLLPGFYDQWVMLERERLQAVYERRCSKLIELLLSKRRWDDVLDWGERWIAMGGIPETAYRAMIMAYTGSGDHAAAAAQYQRLEAALAKEFGIEPSEKTRSLFLQLQDGRLERTLEQSSQPDLAFTCPPAFLEEPEKPLPVFVGRETPLAALKQYLEKTFLSQGQVVFVKGDAGSGKSALLQAFARQSVHACPYILVSWGNCRAFFGQGDPFLPFRNVFDILSGGFEGPYATGTISRNQAQNLFTSFPMIFQAILEKGPDLIDGFIPGSALIARVESFLSDGQYWKEQIEKLTFREHQFRGESEKTFLFEQYTQVLRIIATQRPLMILLDDLQWMDLGSGQLLFHLVRSLQNTRTIIVGAYRAEDVASGWGGQQHPLEWLLQEFQSSYGEIIIDLDQERESSGRNFINAFLDTEPNLLDEFFRTELFRRTHGHPLFTIQLLRDLQERGELYQTGQQLWTVSSDLNWEFLPKQIEGVIGERIGRLDRGLQELLLVACVEGEYFTLQVLEEILGLEKRVLLQQLCRSLEKRHRLVQELGEVRVGEDCLTRFKFTHALIQHYLYSKLGKAERSELHREVAVITERLYQDDHPKVAASLAHHFREAGINQKAVEYLLIAGDQARKMFALSEAIENYQQALILLREMGATEQIARTLMKMFLAYHGSFDFTNAQRVLEECKLLWQKLAREYTRSQTPLAKTPLRLPILKTPIFDPARCDTLFDLEWINELYCGLVGWSEDRNMIPMAAKHWEILDNGRQYVFHLREDIQWSDGEPLTAQDFKFAWIRVLDPKTNCLSANLLYDIRGARDFNQGLISDPARMGISVIDQYTLSIELEEPCSYFPFILGDPISFAVPKHVIELEGNNWTEPSRIVSNGAFQLETLDLSSGKTVTFSRNPRYFGTYKGNIDRVTLILQKNEMEMYHSFAEGKLDIARFLITPIQQDVLNHFREVGQLHISNVPFVDAVYFVVSRPPFDNPCLRRAFALATDREILAREIKNQLPAIGGYIPPGLAGHSPDIGHEFDPQEARRILADAGYPGGKGFPTVGLMLNIVGLEKGDTLVFDYLQDMWKEHLGITVQKCINESNYLEFETDKDFHLFFIGWLADYPDPASFLQTNYLITQTGWRDSAYEELVEKGRRTIDQVKRLALYQQADRILIDSAVVIPLFYGHINELQQPWVQKSRGLSIYSPQWKDITINPH